MRTRIAILASAMMLPLVGLLMGADGGNVQDKELTHNPGLLLSTAIHPSELTVYGVRLGDSVQNISPKAGVTLQGSERTQDEEYLGPNVCYYASGGVIYQIKLLGDITKALPPYDPTRLQMTLGRADEITQPETDVTHLSYFSRHVRYTCHAGRTVASVDMYGQ